MTGRETVRKKKEEPGMKKIFVLLLAVMMLAALAVPAAAEDQGKDMWVYTKNGKSLMIRSSMSTKEDNIVGSLPYGSKVVTFGSPQNGWIYIQWGEYGDHYVMARYLVNYKPAPYDPSSAPAETNSKSFDTTSATTVEQMNTLLASAKSVAPYTVTVRPARASGWVYMRWLPSRNAAQIATYRGSQQLTVIAELKDWYQVEDPDTGRVGFVYKSYIQ